MSTTLTARQKQILDFIHRTLEDRGYPPSIRETARHFHIKGPRAVEKHLAALVRKGFLNKGQGPRAIEPTTRGTGRRIPIVGTVAAGQPILAQENVEETLTLDPSLLRWKDAFLLRVKGDSMKDAAILNGDLVMVRPQNTAESGDIVVAMIENEATVKRLVKKGGEYFLQPENPAYEPISINKRDDENEPLRIIGKVVGVLRIGC